MFARAAVPLSRALFHRVRGDTLCHHPESTFKPTVSRIYAIPGNLFHVGKVKEQDEVTNTIQGG